MHGLRLLSSSMFVDPVSVLCFRPAGIDLMLNTNVVSADLAGKSLKTESGEDDQVRKAHHRHWGQREWNAVARSG